MQYKDKFTMQDLFQNRKLESLLPQFYKKDGLKNVYSFKWVEEKITKYVKSVLKAKIVGDELFVKGNHKTTMQQLNRLKQVLESMFNNIPSITKNIRKNTRLFLPIESLDELKQIKRTDCKLKVLEWVLENVQYNPAFETKQKSTPLHIKEQERWLKKVGLK